MRQERLDGVARGALETQICEPERLKLLLGEMLEASAEADERRARDLTQGRLLKTQAETRLRKLYEALADGKASLKEPVFANMLAEATHRITSLTASVESLERQTGEKARHVTPERVDAFASVVRERLRGEDPAFRKAYVAIRLECCNRPRDDPHLGIYPNTRKSHRKGGTGPHGHGAHL